MPKLPECDRCQLNPHNPFVVCAVHPTGPDSDRCLDFRPAAETEELWEPEGARYINDELVLNRPTYDGQPVPMPRQRFTLEEKMQLLDYHPLFTGQCPQCGHQFDMENPLPVHWDCPECGWCDDSV